MSRRRITYVSGTRADFGLMKATLLRLQHAPDLAVDLLVTGMHLDDRYGRTVDEIQRAALPIRARVPVPLQPSNGATMAANIGRMTLAFTDALAADPPDLVLLLGDRGEQLAGALAGLHLGLANVHIHGGERSGTVDEPVRHAVSKLSHYHCVATEGSRERLLRMGEHRDAIFVTGAPGLDGLADMVLQDRTALCGAIGIDPTRPVALVLFHPVLQEAATAGRDMQAILDALQQTGWQAVCLMPNADAGSADVRAVIEQRRQPGLHVVTHLARPDFVAWMACCDAMVGNSSAGIIEAATFATPVLNIGSRQNLRERNDNVADLPAAANVLAGHLGALPREGRRPVANRYGDGHAGERIEQVLRTVPIGAGLTPKSNAY